jgi:hypothetical protein
LRPAVTAYASLPLELLLPSMPLQEDTRAPDDMTESRRNSPATRGLP